MRGVGKLSALKGLQFAQRGSAGGQVSLFSSTPASKDSSDRILLRGLVFHGFHGVLPEENKLGQKFVVDATLTCSLKKAGQTDNLEDTVSYADVYRKLLEAVAEELAADIFRHHAAVQQVTLQIRKPHVAVEGVVESLGIEISRTRTASIVSEYQAA